MIAVDILAGLAEAGVTIRAEGERLVVHPASRLSPIMRSALRDRKPELLAMLGGDREPEPDGPRAVSGMPKLRTVARLAPAANDSGPSMPANIHAAAAAPEQAMSRRGGRYALTPAEADRCHAQPWGDAACGRFVARVTKLLRLGVPAGDADDLAERMHLRDFEGDDRRACVECGGLAGHAASGWRCRRAALAGCGVQLAPDLVTRLQRCPGHTPVA